MQVIAEARGGNVKYYIVIILSLNIIILSLLLLLPIKFYNQNQNFLANMRKTIKIQ